MEILWTTNVTTGDSIVNVEIDTPNHIMDFAAALYLHRLDQPTGTPYELLKFVSFGVSSFNSTSTSEEILGSEAGRINIESSFRYIGNDIIALDYEWENNSGSTVNIYERGVVSGGEEYDDIADWDERLETGYLVSRKVEVSPIVVPDGGVVGGTIKIKLNL